MERKPHHQEQQRDHTGSAGIIGRGNVCSEINAIKLTNKFQKKEKSLDKGKKMCGKALKTRLIFRGRAHEIHS